MKTRNEESYVVNHANTGRLKQSAVPYLQRILNLEESMRKGGIKGKIIQHQNKERKKRRPG